MDKVSNLAMPQGFSIESDVDGWAVRFPKILLEPFKAHFRGAKWRSGVQSWLIGPRSKKKFEIWAKEMADEAIQIEALNSLDTEESVEAFIKALMVDKVKVLQSQLDRIFGDDEVKDKYDEIRIEIGRIGKTVETLKESLKTKIETRKLLETKLVEIKKVEAERDGLKADCQLEDKRIKEILDKAIDLSTIQNAYSKMASLFGKVGSQLRREFESAQEIIKEQQQILHALGLHSLGMEEMYQMNMNRPDRDRLPNFSSIYNLVQYSDDDQ